MTMPRPALTPFQQELSNWQKKLQSSITGTETLQANIRGLESRVRFFQTPVVSGFARLTGKEKPQLQPGQKPPRDVTGAFLAGGKRFATSIFGGEERSASQVEAAILSDDIKVANKELLKKIFYTDVYSIIPALISVGAVNNPDEALGKISLPDNLTADEIQSVKNEIAQLLSSRNRGVVVEEEEEPSLPPLQPPPESRPTATSIHSLSTQAILRSLTAPRVPQTTMTREEYRAFLTDKGWNEEDVDAEVGMTTEKLIAEAQNRKNLIDSFKNEIYKLPDLTGMDVLKMSIINPPLAILEGLGTYYEHVSMPAAGWLYSKAIPDITVAYNEFKSQNPDATEREAWVYAWNKWEAPGPPVFDFILKYMLMEGLVDPLTYAGWGIVTKGLRALGPAGRIVAIGNAYVGEVMELPFDFIKWSATGVASKTGLSRVLSKLPPGLILPKTIRQTAIVFSRNSESTIKVAFEKFHKSSIPLYEMTPKQMKDAGDFVLEHLVKNPRAEDDMALAARELLVHAPIDKKTAANWAERLRKISSKVSRGISELERIGQKIIKGEDLSLAEEQFRVNNRQAVEDYLKSQVGKIGQVTLVSVEITSQTLKDMSDIFERVFTKQTTPAEEAGALLRKLGVMEITEDTQILAEKLLTDRANNIFSKALDFTASDTTRHALTALSKKQSKIYEDIASSLAHTEAIKAGRFALFIHNIEKRYVESWMHYLNRYVIRSAADSYLTFAGYGFGNAGEDIVRSILGGVRPGRVSREDWDVFTIGLIGDPTLRARGISEMSGLLREVDEGAWHNWILTFSTLWAGLPTYLVTRGKITPRQVAEKAFEVMVEMPGAFSADVRRNFTWGKAGQILAETGGEAYEALTKALPKAIPDTLKGMPKWEQKKLLRDIRNYGLTGKLTSDNTQLVKTLKGGHTHDKIVKAELEDIFAKYPELSPSLRSETIRDFKEILKSPDSINEFNKRSYSKELDDFIRSPEKATVDFEKLTDYLTQLEVTNPEAMSDLISGLYRMTATYGALPDQIMARATVKSRGLPVADRKLQFDTDFDRIHTFMDKAGASIDTVVDKIESSLAERALSPSENLVAESKELLRRAKLLQPDNKDVISFAELLDKALLSTGQSRNKLLAKIDDSGLENSLRSIIDVKPGKSLLPKLKITDAHRAALRSYLDLSTTARKVISEAKSQDIAFRSSYFADATQKEMRTSGFWETFYASEMSHWKNTSKKLAILNAQLSDSIDNINVSLGSKSSARPPVIVPVGKELSPSDIGKLVGARGDDLGRMLLDTLIPEGDRDYFVTYVVGKAKKNGSVGFTPDAVGKAYDQIAASMMIDPASSSWFRIRHQQLEALGRDLHDLYNSKLFPKEQKVAVDKFIDESVAELDKLLTKKIVPDLDLGLHERMPTAEDIAQADKEVEEYIRKHFGNKDTETSRKAAEKAIFGEGGRQAAIEGKVPFADEQVAEDLKISLQQVAQKVVLEEDVVAFKDIVDALKKREGFEKAWRGNTETLFEDIDILNPERLQNELTRLLNVWERPSNDALSNYINKAMDRMEELARSDKTLEDFIQSWFSYYKNSTLQKIGMAASKSPEYLAKVRGILKEHYPSGHIRIFRGLGKAGEKHLEREFTNVTSSKRIAKEFSNTWGMVSRKDPLVDNVLVKIEDIVAIGSVDESELIIPAKVLRDRIDHPLVAPRAVSAPFQNYDQLRQSALDEALTWYYKEYTDQTNANMLDAMMKQLFPFWTYESQRWLWLPRSFIRRPGTLAQWGRWENNTDQGYVHIPGTSIDINPFRGTVYGPWSTRLMKRDYPEYYDQLEGMGGLIGFFDFISRYGFYPNIIYGALVSQFGGATEQLGGILPAQASTPLNALIAAFPDNPVVNFISERVFPEQFRTYLTARGVDDLGGDGSLLFAKMKGNIKLTEEEESLWTQARRTTALHSAAFEQFGFARMRTDQSYALAQASAQFIEENWGITVNQQQELRRRGDKLWDIIGGLDPWETAALQELEFFKYAGSVNPVLPSTQQEILTRIERDWSDVMTYSEAMRAEVLNLQQDFLTGSERGRLGADDFLYRVRDLYKKRREYIDKKTEANPLMLLDNRTEYYAKYRQPMPVQSPYNELMDLFFSIELEDTVDPATGERVIDWDKFWANRQMIQDSIPAEDRTKWDTFLSRHTAPIMQVWQDVYTTYFKKYYSLYDEVLKHYTPEEQRIINEYLYLERTGQQLDRQALLKEAVTKDGKQIISDFRTTVSNEREALRYANPHLDAWLYYWSRTSSFKTRKAEEVYKQLAKSTGRTVD